MIDYRKILKTNPILFGKIKKAFQGESYKFWADTKRLQPNSDNPFDYLPYLTDAQIRKLFDLCIRFKVCPADLNFYCEFKTIEVKRMDQIYYIDFPENIVLNIAGMIMGILPDGSSHT
jgi:hypothetical protein